MSDPQAAASSLTPGTLSGISPEPQEDEAAAIAAAVTVAVTGAAAEPELQTIPRWRFSGRWWSAPVTSRRSRP